MRRAWRMLGWAVVVLLLCAGGLLLALPRVELASFVAGRASAALGRAVEIAGLRILPGRDITIDLSGLRIANIPGGSAPDMARLEKLSARISLPALLRGALVVRDAEMLGFTLLLEKDGEGRRNWRFGGDRRPVPGATPAMLPLVHALGLAGAEIVVRTSSGAALTTRIDRARLSSADPMLATLIEAEGAYNGAPITARVDAGPLAALREGRPMPVALHARSGDTTLEFEGTARDPLNADGVEGRLALAAPTPDALLGMAQAALPISLDVAVEGTVRRDGNLWRMEGIEGRLFEAPFTGALVEMNEGDAGQPDAITASLDFSRLDLNRILGPNRADRPGGADDSDLPLVVPERPDPRLDVRLGAGELAYARLDARDVRLVAVQHPGRIAVEELLLTASGARLQATAALTPGEGGTRIEASAALLEGELDALRRALRIRPLPLAGPLQARLSIAAVGATMNRAFHQAKVDLVVAMQGGTVARSVIEMASTNLRALFRRAEGNTRLTCLLAVIDMAALRGEASPIRIRAATGTVVGQGRFDLSRRTLDLVIGSQRDTTEFLALDVPVRVYGSFADPDIGLSEWSPASRGRLGAGDDVSALPEELRSFARENPCYRAPRRR